MKLTIMEMVEYEVTKQKRDIEIANKNLSENYCYAFAWNYPEQLYKSNFAMSYLSILMDFIDNKPGEVGLWLIHNINDFTNSLLSHSLTEHSTSLFSNLAYSYGLEVKQYLLKEFKTWLTSIEKGYAIKETETVNQ